MPIFSQQGCLFWTGVWAACVWFNSTGKTSWVCRSRSWSKQHQSHLPTLVERCSADRGAEAMHLFLGKVLVGGGEWKFLSHLLPSSFLHRCSHLSYLHCVFFFFLPFELLPTNCASSRGNKAWPDTFLAPPAWLGFSHLPAGQSRPGNSFPCCFCFPCSCSMTPRRAPRGGRLGQAKGAPCPLGRVTGQEEGNSALEVVF